MKAIDAFGEEYFGPVTIVEIFADGANMIHPGIKIMTPVRIKHGEMTDIGRGARFSSITFINEGDATALLTCLDRSE